MKQVSFHTSSILKGLQIILVASVLLYFGKTLFIPLFMGLLVAMVMYPVCRRLEARGWTRTMAVTLSVSIVVLLFFSLIFLLYWQLRVFLEDWPSISQKLDLAFTQLQSWWADQLGIAVKAQASWWQQLSAQVGNLAAPLLRGTLGVTVSTLFILFMTPVFAALFLYHRKVFVRALLQYAGPLYREQLEAVLVEVTETYFRYIKGMIIVYLIVGALNSVGLAALGIPHALLFGMLTAVMTIIPYIGIIVSALLPISAAWISHTSIWYPLGVIGVFSFVQYLEANVIFPKVVAAQLNVSTWATLVAILAGGVIWGVAGMVLFIPFVAILKIMADHMENWEVLRTLLARNTAELHKIK